MRPAPRTIPKERLEQVSHAATLEYEGILNLCRHLELCLDPKNSESFIRLVKDSINHLDFTSAMMKEAGVPAQLNINPQPKRDAQAALARQLELERLSAWLYKSLATQEDSEDIKKTLLNLATTERRHAALVEDIMANLGKAKQ